MYEIAKLEFGKWLSKLEIDTLSKYEKALIGIILDHFDDIAQCGTAGGVRAKLIGNYIENLHGEVKEENLVMQSCNYDTEHIIRLHSLCVKEFRGFGVQEDFDFSKQYTFFHGPNGSGKTSFCEAIEYCVLGTIAEASERNIPLDKYITHAGCKKATAPILLCDKPDGTTDYFPTDLSTYRFAFIEKNRILNFSHIGAATAKTQSDRMASLFGLSEFQSFIHEFTDSFDKRYITLESDAQEKYKTKTGTIEVQKKQLDELNIELGTHEAKLSELITKLNEPSVKSFEQAKTYLSDPETGAIAKAGKIATTHHMNLIVKDTLDELGGSVDRFLTAVSVIQDNNQAILSDLGTLNLTALYEDILALKSSYKGTVCPVCQTPLTDTAVNPFDYASEELVKFRKIEESKKTVQTNSKNAVISLQKIIEELTNKEIAGLFSSIDMDMIFDSSLQAIDYENINESNLILVQQLRELKKALNDEDMLLKRIEEYNAAANESNREYSAITGEYQKLFESITTENGVLTASRTSISKLENSLVAADKEIEQLKTASDKETLQIEFNKQMVVAYNSVIEKLNKYVEGLPIELAKDLSDKACEYYNIINHGDADFELIKELHLPVAVNEKMIIKMKDGIAQDALQILSEGHVRILGLAILLAKAIKEKMPFIVFDDIVNSIDDDHRDGVALLLISCPDFVDTQMVLTCHGELFVSSLESYVDDQSKMARYMFLPADTLDERGVVIKYQDSSIPLKVAREKYVSGNLKDSAAKCRQAVECITGKLWKKISPTTGGISVQIRNLQSGPDLSQTVDGLCKVTKGTKILGIEEIHDLLGNLRDTRIWAILNKGTHIDSSLPEFSRVEIRELLELIEKLNDAVNKLEIKPTVVVKNST